MKKKLIVLSTIGVILIGIIAGASYAYFTVGNNTGNEDVITSGTMSLLLTDGAEVTANNLVPGDYVEKTFKVKNTGNVDTRYDIYLSEVINTFVDKTDLVYTLTSLDGGYNTSSELQVPDTETKIVNQQLITPNEEHTYTLRITFKLKQTIQNANMGRTFTAKININEYNSNTQEKLLKIIDASGNEVDKQIVGASQTNYTLSLSNTNLTNSTNIYCNNGGIPTISGNTLNVSGITNDTVCTISNNIVDTINNKLTTSKTGIVMTNDQSSVAKMTIPSTKEVVLDLNGKEIRSVGVNESNTNYNDSHVIFYLTSSKLVLNDTIGTGGLYTGVSAPPLRIDNSDLTINGGHYNGRQSFNMYNSGNILINNGEFNCLWNATLTVADNCNNCTLTINDGIFKDDQSVFDSQIANVIMNAGNNTQYIINGGTFTSIDRAIYTYTTNNGTININGGNFNSVNYGVLNNSGTININGGNIESTSNNTLYNNTNGLMTIDGNQASFDNNNNYLSGTYIHSNAKAQLVNNYGNLHIKNGTFKTFYRDAVGECDVYNNGGTLVIDDGDYYSYRDINVYAYADSSNITINGGTYYSEMHTNVFHNFGVMKVFGGTFNSKNKTAINSNKGTLYIIDGVFNGKIVTAVNGSAKASDNYICGGTFNNSGNDLNINDADSSLKYKSSVVWTGKTGPTIGGSYPSLATLDDTITCPES